MRIVNIATSLCLLASGCASSSAGTPPVTRTHLPTLAPKTDAMMTASALPEGAPRKALAWGTFDAATFARAKSERKFVVLDGSAEWCHWCHVMEATTYHDDAVRSILDARFLSVKVDVDARPDIEERYGDYGWPATVIFSPDGVELGKYRGYIAPEKFAGILRDVVATSAGAAENVSVAAEKLAISDAPMPEEELAWIARFVAVELEEYWDDARGGWGRAQKAAVASDNAWAISNARRGDATWKARALFTLGAELGIVDPVWGGIYQYSAAPDWDHPHFEKLMPYQAGALDNYADAYALTRDPKYLAVATKMRAYIEGFLLGPAGGFYATQDADLNAHDASKRFMNGHDYYAMDDAHRRAAGTPRVDTHEYGKENGLAIAAYCTYFEATKDASALAIAERAAARILATHAVPERGGVAHDVVTEGAPARVLYLGDNAAFAFALVRLYDVTKNRAYVDGAARIADMMLRDMQDPRGGGFFASTADPDAAGVFSARRTPSEENVIALRMLARLAKADAPNSVAYRRAIARTFRAIATPERIKDRGRVLGDFLLAVEETRGVR